MRHKKIIGLIILIFFFAVFYIQIDRHTKIPDHIHSVDDKKPEERTDEENITVLERTLQKEPDNISIMLQLSDIYLKTGQNGDAIDMLEKILEIEPSNKEALDKLKQFN